MVATSGAILAGRRGYDAGLGQPSEAATKPYGGAWSGTIFVLTHHPEDAVPDRTVTFLNCDIAQAVKTGLDAAGGRNLEVFGSDIARQCATRGLTDEFYVHIAPMMLGATVQHLADLLAKHNAPPPEQVPSRKQNAGRLTQARPGAPVSWLPRRGAGRRSAGDDGGRPRAWWLSSLVRRPASPPGLQHSRWLSGRG